MTLKTGTLSPGLHFNVAPDVYHADPCERPSLNQSIAKLLVPGNRSPLHAWHAHPRLNPDREDETSARFDLGSTAHALLIGRGKNVSVLDFDDWRTNASKEARENARAAGHVPMLRHQYDVANAMSEAARIQLRAIVPVADAVPFQDGDGEVVAIARQSDWQEGGYFFRTMIDWLTPDHLTCVDYKTTEASASPNALQFRVSGEEWPIQAAMQEFILDIIEPENAGRRDFMFVCQEAYEPYALTVGHVPESTMHIARAKLAAAIERWKECLRTNVWPGYGTEVVTLEYPPHVAARWMEQEARNS